MMSKTIISLALLSCFSHLLILIAKADFVYYNCSIGKGTCTSTSAYQSNLITLLSNYTSDTKIDYGFYNSSYGPNPDTVNALGLCRGDVSPDSCRSCLNNATALLPKLCPNQKEAFGYSDFCTFQYSNRSIFGIYQDPEFFYAFNNPEKAADAEKYANALMTTNGLMQSLKSKAAAGDSRRKLAVGNATAGQSQTVYGLAQCTPDLSEKDCDSCLVKAISNIPGCCENKIGGRVIKLSCNLRFEKVQFYDPTAVDPILSSSPPALAPSSNTTSSPGVADSPKASTSSKGNSNRTSRIVVIVAVLIGSFITLY